MPISIKSRKNEVLFKETKDSKQRFYVNPQTTDQAVVINITNTVHVADIFKRIFLPEGYPESVSKDYKNYQIWDTAQAFCSTIAGILATQEVLRGVGVGDSNATVLAATITWVLKDGCGHISRILFAFTHGKYLDAYSKKWRMYADILNNVAMCIEIALPNLKNYSLFALCISTSMKSIVGIAGGATRVAMTQHHAVTGNLADVAAKDAAQETAVNLLASLFALLILSCFGSSLVIFMVMMVLHVTFNYRAVRAVCLRTLNEPRFLLLIDRYTKHEVVAAPHNINKIEPIGFYQLGRSTLDLKICGFRITLGASLQDAFEGKIEVEELSRLRHVYSDRPYVLVPNIKRRSMHVLIKRGATAEDVLGSYFHAVMLAFSICATNNEHSPEHRDSKPHSFSTELLLHLNETATTEWMILRAGLKRNGWDIGTHQLVTGQWRLEAEDSSSVDGTSIFSRRH